MEISTEKIPGKYQRYARALLLAILTVLNGNGVYQNLDQVQLRQSKGAPLTEGEVKMAHDLFGNQLDVSKFTKHSLNCVKRGAGAFVTQREKTKIAFCDNALKYKEDYSKNIDGVHLNVFYHELTHHWQIQTGNSLTRMDCGWLKDKYAYAMTDSSRFEEYCTEQQADMVGSYAHRFLNPAYTPTPEENNSYSLKIVEEMFPQARITRLAVETQREQKTAALTPR